MEQSRSIAEQLTASASLGDAELEREIAKMDAQIASLEGELQAERDDEADALQRNVGAVATRLGGADDELLQAFACGRARPSAAWAGLGAQDHLFELEADEPTGVADGGLAEIWFEKLRGGIGGGGGTVAAQQLTKTLSAQLLMLGPAEVGERDGLVALLAPLLAPPQLWALCVRWRERNSPPPPVEAAAAAAGAAARAAGELEAWLDASLGWLTEDAGLLHSLCADTVFCDAVSPEQMMEQLCLRRVDEHFRVALGKLRAIEPQEAAAAAAAVQEAAAEALDAALVASGAVASAALRCFRALLRFKADARALLHLFAPALASCLGAPPALARAVAEVGPSPAAAQLEQLAPWLGELIEVALERRCRAALAAEARSMRSGMRGVPSVELAAAAEPGSVCPPRCAKSCTHWVELASELALGTSDFFSSPRIEKGGGGSAPSMALPAAVGVSVAAAVAGGVEQLCERWAGLSSMVPHSAGREQLLLAQASAEYVALFVAVLSRTELARQEWAAWDARGAATAASAAARPAPTRGGSRSPSPEPAVTGGAPQHEVVARLLRRASAALEAAKEALGAAIEEGALRLCRGFIIPDLDQDERWISHRPFLPRRDEVEARCSHALPMWQLFLAGFDHDLRRHLCPAAAAAMLGAIVTAPASVPAHLHAAARLEGAHGGGWPV
eukprot:SAG11_NODE_3926_length_2145_cov_1.348974_1_plen_674_part_10